MEKPPSSFQIILKCLKAYLNNHQRQRFHHQPSPRDPRSSFRTMSKMYPNTREGLEEWCKDTESKMPEYFYSTDRGSAEPRCLRVGNVVQFGRSRDDVARRMIKALNVPVRPE